MINIVPDSKDASFIEAKNVNPNNPIFAIKGGKVAGMLVKEDKGWALRTGD